MLLETERAGDGLTLRASGAWCIDNLAEMETALAGLPSDRPRRVIIDCARIEKLDLSGAWLLHKAMTTLREAGVTTEFAGKPPAHFAFIEEMSERAAAAEAAPEEPDKSLRDALAWVGRVSIQQAHQARDALGFFGRMSVTSLRTLRSLHHLRVASIVRHIHETGIQAIPIVSLIAFLISVIIAYLSAQQLRQFGARNLHRRSRRDRRAARDGRTAHGDHRRGPLG